MIAATNSHNNSSANLIAAWFAINIYFSRRTFWKCDRGYIWFVI